MIGEKTILFLAGCWWLTPVFLATHKVEIRRIMFVASMDK
jgi:hypothetical protein